MPAMIKVNASITATTAPNRHQLFATVSPFVGGILPATYCYVN